MKIAASLLGLLLLVPGAAPGAELVQLVRGKLSAGDLQSGIAGAEEYKRNKGVDAEYLDAIGWLARGAEMLRQDGVAARFVAELRREIKEEKAESIGAFGAAIEVEGRLLAAREGRGAALRFLEAEFARAQAIPLRSRIRKNINLLSLEGQAAADMAEHKGKPVLLFLWAHWCGDCKAQAAQLERVWRKFRERGLVALAPTRYYGTGADGKSATPDEEKAHAAKVWRDLYAGLEDVPLSFDTETMVRYGGSATPTFVLIDRAGVVRFYAPTRLSEDELTRRIEAVLAETR